MINKKQIINKIESEDFDYEEQVKLYELTPNESKSVRESLKEGKVYYLKENSGTEHQLEEFDEVRDLLDKKNITEVIVEQMSLQGAKRYHYKLSGSLAKKGNILRNEIEQKYTRPFVQDCENFLIGKVADETTGVPKQIAQNLHASRAMMPESNNANGLNSTVQESTQRRESSECYEPNFIFKGQNSQRVHDGDGRDDEQEELQDGISSHKSKTEPAHNEDYELTYEDVLFSRRKLVKRSNAIYKSFFRVKNNSELFKVGKSYLEDFLSGKSCFGFSSDGDVDAMVSGLYGISVFFNFYNHSRVLILLNDDEILKLQSYFELGEPKRVYDQDLDMHYDVWENEGISVISYTAIEIEHRSKAYDLVDKLVAMAGVTLCSFPHSGDFENNIDLYFQVLQRVDNFSFMIRKNKTSIKEVQKLVNDFQNYNVNIKGVMIGS